MAFWRPAPKEPIFDPTNVLVIGGYDVAAGFVYFVGIIALCLVFDIIWRSAWKKPADQPVDPISIETTPSTASILK